METTDATFGSHKLCVYKIDITENYIVVLFKKSFACVLALR